MGKIVSPAALLRIAITNLEVAWEKLKMLPCQRHAFDVGVTLGFDREHGLVEHDSLVLFREHAHEAFHEVLRGADQSVVSMTMLA